ncbi:MAG: 4-oxalomesaconate tautomerase [Hyphomicrobiales bacterium]|nr:4-oxalomesaconate tautomerase [Hyphomicrobiales bacterium]
MRDAPRPPARGLRRVPCVLMRGGTSRGPFFLESDLPAGEAARDAFLLNVMGSPHPLQVDGIGGANSLTSKVAIVSRSSRPDADVDYLFAQVSVEQPLVDTSPNCGNMLSAVGPFALEMGLVPAQDGETTVRIFNRNTSSLVEAVIQTPGGAVAYDGDTAIDGVAGAAAPIGLSFGDAAGGKTGALFPSGERREEIHGVGVTLIDYAMPMMLLAASDVGLNGDETPAQIDADRDLYVRLEAMRMEAGRRMGLGDVTGRVIPKIGLLSAPRRGGTITSRYLVPDSCHRAHSATGALCVAAASRLEGTVAFALAAQAEGPVVVEHPSGAIPIALTAHAEGVSRAAFVRTARRIFEGNLLVPAALYDT